MDKGAPLGGDQNRGPTLIAVSWAWAVVSTVLVALRFYSRIRFARRLWHDDWWILISLILTLTFTILWTIYATIGGCRHIFYLSTTQWYSLTKINWISQPFCVMAIASGKVSVAYLILRLQAPCKWRTGLLYFIAASAVVFGAVDCVITFAQCSPAYALWTADVAASCWSTDVLTDYALALTVYYALLDIALALIPISFVCSLQLSARKKLSICLLLSLGLLAGVCAFIKMTKIPELGARDDTTWNTTDLFIWNANEINLVIIAACIPSLRPLLASLRGDGPASAPSSSRARSASTSRNRFIPVVVLPYDRFHALGTRDGHVGGGGGGGDGRERYAWSEAGADGDSEKGALALQGVGLGVEMARRPPEGDGGWKGPDRSGVVGLAY
ncbi:hypothetical protein MMC26_005329 [Xylographa opegraphella]|nr:hypothetical protein [Xylographa opegraphella]